MLKRELRQFLRDTKPLWELGFGGVLAVFLAEAATHLQWIATNVTGTTGMIIILLPKKPGQGFGGPGEESRVTGFWKGSRRLKE
jgi:hypothetical protein